MLTKYEVWQSPESTTIFPAEESSKHYTLLDKEATLLRIIEASCFEDAMVEHHRLMGWEPYVKF